MFPHTGGSPHGDGEKPTGGHGKSRRHADEAKVPLGPPPPLKILIDAGLLEPGPGRLSVKYRGAAIDAELRPDGTILYQGKAHHAPSGFSLAAKRGVNPAVFSDDGWGNVRYIPPVLTEDEDKDDVKPMTLLAIRDRHEGRQPHTSRYRARGEGPRSRVRVGGGQTVYAPPVKGAGGGGAAAGRSEEDLEGELRKLRKRMDPKALAAALVDSLARTPFCFFPPLFHCCACWC